MDKGIVNELIIKLGRSNIIEYFFNSADKPHVDMSIMERLYEHVEKISVVNNCLCYKDSKNKVEQYPHINVNVSDAGFLFSSNITAPGFYIMQLGNIRKSEEAKSMYICAVISVIMKDHSFSYDLNHSMKSFISKKMISNKGVVPFSELIKTWQSFQSMIVNVIVSGYKYRISVKGNLEDYKNFLIND